MLHNIVKFIMDMIHKFGKHHVQYNFENTPMGRVLSKISILPRRRARFIAIGSFIAFIGYILPWYQILYFPHTKSTVINGITVSSFLIFRNGFGQASLDASAGNLASAYIIQGILGAIVLLYLIGVISQIFFLVFPLSRTPRFIIFFEWFLHSSQVFGYLAGFYNRFSSGTALVEVRYQFISQLGGGKIAEQASQYLTTDIFFGFWILVAGLAISAIGIYSGEIQKDQNTISQEELVGNQQKIRALVIIFVFLIADIIFLWVLKTSGIFDITPFLTPFWDALKSLFVNPGIQLPLGQ